MSKQWGSKQTNKDIFLSFFQKAVEKVQSHKKQVFLGVLVVIAIGLFVFLFFRRRNEINLQAADILSNAQGYHSKKEYTQAISLYDEIINNYPQSQVIGLAFLFKGDVLYEEGKYKEAAAVYKKRLNQHKKSSIVPFVEINLGNCYEEEGNWEEALKIYEKFVERNTEHMLVPSVYQAIGRCCEQLDKKELAISTYQKIVALYSDTQWEKLAKFKLEELETKNQSEKGKK